MTAYELAIWIVGGVDVLAATLGVTRQAIYAWKGKVPKKHLDSVLAAVRLAARARRKLANRRLPTKRELRPDLFTPKSRGAGRGNAKNGETRGKEKSSSKTQRAEAAQEENR